MRHARTHLQEKCSHPDAKMLDKVGLRNAEGGCRANAESPVPVQHTTAASKMFQSLIFIFQKMFIFTEV